MTVTDSGAAISEIGGPVVDTADAPGLADRERTVKSPCVPLSYERLCLKVIRLERVVRAQRAYAHRLLLRARKAEASLREITDGVAHV